MNNLRRACHRVNSRNAALSGVDNYKVGLNLLVFTPTPIIDLIYPRAGPTTLMVQATLIDFPNSTNPDALAVRREPRDIARSGALLCLMELKDSESGRVLERAADSASAPKFSYSRKSTTDWSAVETAAARWAEIFVNSSTKISATRQLSDLGVGCSGDARDRCIQRCVEFVIRLLRTQTFRQRSGKTRDHAVLA